MLDQTHTPGTRRDEAHLRRGHTAALEHDQGKEGIREEGEVAGHLPDLGPGAPDRRPPGRGSAASHEEPPGQPEPPPWPPAPR